MSPDSLPLLGTGCEVSRLGRPNQRDIDRKSQQTYGETSELD